MPWVVDTCLVLDVLEADPEFGQSTAAFLQGKLDDGLVVCPMTAIELAPAFDGNWSDLEYFLHETGIGCNAPWEAVDTAAAFHAWHGCVRLKRARVALRRPLADILIGAFACRFRGLLTRNPGDFQPFFRSLTAQTPSDR